jgi:nitroimidazol reductase NimA-like FMN-containing flavoprotein (pyridoxamine 5'-phosphate oxidase superfamily)
MDDAEIESLLRSEKVGRLGCHARGRTYVVPVAYVYDEGVIIAHAADGLKVQMMRENPSVCFEIDRVDDLTHWQSVIAWGTFEELKGLAADHALAIYLGRMLPLTATHEASQTPKTLTRQHRAREDELPAVTFCIRIHERTGRFER